MQRSIDVMHYPHIDPIIVGFGPIAIRWYGLAYLTGFVLAWWLGNRRARSMHNDWTEQQVSDVVFYGALGAVLGGRIGYVFFYGFKQFIARPGVAAAHLGRRHVVSRRISRCRGRAGVVRARDEADIPSGLRLRGAVGAPGLGFGRLGNFANTELPGRMTDSPFGLIYPCHADAIRAMNPMCTGAWEEFARHPSPLYQAFAEGAVLFTIVWLYSSKPRPVGAVSGLFMIAYGALRFTTEFFREPDAHLGFIALNWLTMGQLLSIPMVLFGIVLLLVFPEIRVKQYLDLMRRVREHGVAKGDRPAPAR